MLCGQHRAYDAPRSSPSDLSRFIGPRNESSSDRQSIPGIDGCNGQRQIRELFLSEMAFDFLVDTIARVSVGDERHGFDPCQRRALAVGIVGRLPPGIEPI